MSGGITRDLKGEDPWLENTAVGGVNGIESCICKTIIFGFISREPGQTERS
ncbi:hypothetical protein VIBNIAM115_1850091 [Vibrio nigripulchritudo AM115]|nr:hypothetical protein VIBNIAM115_1850091 [Vibrio nigripulchritudo AM115]